MTTNAISRQRMNRFQSCWWKTKRRREMTRKITLPEDANFVTPAADVDWWVTNHDKYPYELNQWDFFASVSRFLFLLFATFECISSEKRRYWSDTASTPILALSFLPVNTNDWLFSRLTKTFEKWTMVLSFPVFVTKTFPCVLHVGSRERKRGILTFEIYLFHWAVFRCQ